MHTLIKRLQAAAPFIVSLRTADEVEPLSVVEASLQEPVADFLKLLAVPTGGLAASHFVHTIKGDMFASLRRAVGAATRQACTSTLPVLAAVGREDEVRVS